jgi:hypothetical protein
VLQRAGFSPAVSILLKSIQLKNIMPTSESLSAIAQMNLIQSVDDGRAAEDHFKLPIWLRAQIDTDLTSLDQTDNDTVEIEGSRAGSSAAAKAAIEALEDYLREGYKFIDAIRASKITDAQRLEVFTAYGWSRGLIGRFNNARTLALAGLALDPQEQLDAARRYPADLVADIQAKLDEYNTEAPVSATANRQQATANRDEALDRSKETLSQTRFYYCSASRETDQSLELAKAGFRPRRVRCNAFLDQFVV